MTSPIWRFGCALLLGAGGVTAQTTPDPLSNLRPNNITGLAYYLYRWTGSYYNGTTTIRIEPQNYMEDSACENFSDDPVEIVYDNSMLAVTKSNGHIVENNPLAFSLRFWESSVDIVPSSDTSNEPINDIVDIESIDYNTNAQPISTLPPYWNLTTSDPSPSSLAENASYSFTGYRNYSIAPQNLLFTGPQCFAASLTTAKYNGILLEFDPDEENGSRVNLTVGGPPTVSARFDGKSASLEIKGMLSSSSKKEGANDVVYLGGPITISFLGSIDDSRSDELLSNSLNGTPIWNETLGYSKLLSGEEVKKEGIGSRTEIGMWTLMISACVAFMFGF